MKQDLSFLENLKGRKLRLKLPEDPRDVIQCARYFHLFERADVELVVSAPPLVKEMLSQVQCRVTYLDEIAGHDDGYLTYDATKLGFFFNHCVEAIPYVVVPEPARHQLDQVFRDSKRCIALCLDDVTNVLEEITSSFTFHQLVNFNFCIFSEKPVHIDRNLFPPVDFFNFSLEETGLSQACALLKEMFSVVAQENLFAHLAGAMGKKVWLLTSGTAAPHRISLFATSYPSSTIVRAGNGITAAMRKVSLSHYFIPSEDFSPFTTACRSPINVDVKTIDPPIDVQCVDDLDKILDVNVPCLNNVQIETTTICNLSCSYCPNSTIGREHARMETQTYHRIIDSLADYLPGYCGTVAPHFYGEPLTDDRLEALVGYTRRKLPRAVIEVYTNGELLDAERFMALKEAGVDLFRISQHTEQPSETIQKSLTYIQKRHPEMFTIDYKVFHEAPAKANRGGLVSTPPASYEVMKQTAGCSMAHRVMTFDYRGNAVLCCNDYLSRHSFGNIKQLSVMDIWEESKYKKIRNAIMFGYLPFPMCKTCMWLAG